MYPFSHPHINDVPISLEIIDGMGTPNPFGYKGQFGNNYNADPEYLEKLPQVVVNSVLGGSTASTLYGAASIQLNIPVETSVGGAVSNNNIFVIAEDLTPHTKSQRQIVWNRSGDNIKVMLISPNGMSYKEIRFSIVLRPPTTGSTQHPNVYSGDPTLVSETFYDMSGNQIPAGISPQVNVVLNN